MCSVENVRLARSSAKSLLIADHVGPNVGSESWGRVDARFTQLKRSARQVIVYGGHLPATHNVVRPMEIDPLTFADREIIHPSQLESLWKVKGSHGPFKAPVI